MFQAFLKKRSFLFKLRLSLGLILGLLILLIFYFKIIPFGKITYTRTWPTKFHSGQGFISGFKPNNRLDLSNIEEPKIIIDPVYFSVFTPRRFDSASVTIQYYDHLSTSTPLIELGLLKDKLTNSYDLQPLQNDIVDHYRFSWFRLEDTNNRLILERKKNYYSLNNFLNDLQRGSLRGCSGDLRNCLALYNYSLPLKYSLPAYIPLRPLLISQPLRGPHEFYLYLRNTPWKLSLDFTYLDQDPKPDPITVNIWRGNKLFKTKSILSSKLKNVSINFNGSEQKEGVYRVEIRINNDVVIKKIQSSSNKLSFIHRIWPVSGQGNLKIFTDSNNLRVQTDNPASLGKINFGGKTFLFNKAYKPFNLKSGQKNQIISLKKDDLILENSGVFSFSKKSLFDPSVQKINSKFSVGENINYIISDYQEPLENDNLKTAQVHFNLEGASRSHGYYTFVISIPGLGNINNPNNYLEIKKISISLSGKTLWQKIWK